MPIQKNKDYWLNREKQLLIKAIEEEDKLEILLKKAYKKAKKEIEKEIAALFMKYAKDNKLTYAEASKMLTRKEFKEWRMDIKGYIDAIKDSADDRLLIELNTLSSRSRISILEEKLYQIDKYINELYEISYNSTESFLRASITDTYYKNIYSVHKYLEVGASFSLVDNKLIREVLEARWLGSNYSERIWRNRDKLKIVIRDSITDMIIRGQGAKEVAKEVATKMDANLSNAMRLVRSEHSFVMNQASKRSYEELAITKYQYLATLDRRTSDICRSLDSQVFELKDAIAGLNYPPTHANCRSTTAPYIDESTGTRIARDKQDKNIEVPSSWNYEKWKSEFGIEY